MINIMDGPILVEKPIKIHDLKEIASKRFGDLVKAVVDIKKRIMAIGGEMHADEEALLIEHGSTQDDLWGINIYPGLSRENWIEFDSMINIRPRQNNRSRNVEDKKIQEEIIKIVDLLISA